MATKRPMSADYRHAGARAQAIRSGLEHLPRIGGCAHAPARFHAEVLADHLPRSEEHTSELQSRLHLACRLLLEKKKHTHKPVSFPAPNAAPPIQHAHS